MNKVSNRKNSNKLLDNQLIVVEAAVVAVITQALGEGILDISAQIMTQIIDQEVCLHFLETIMIIIVGSDHQQDKANLMEEVTDSRLLIMVAQSIDLMAVIQDIRPRHIIINRDLLIRRHLKDNLQAVVQEKEHKL
jgi:phenylpyruvate tautomerase PptA (4-oxalocrotonate tautomerase family)